MSAAGAQLHQSRVMHEIAAAAAPQSFTAAQQCIRKTLKFLCKETHQFDQNVVAFAKFGHADMAPTADAQVRCPSPMPNLRACWRNAPTVLFICFEILATGVLAFECLRNSACNSFVQATRFFDFGICTAPLNGDAA
jgi:hypothetical protein